MATRGVASEVTRGGRIPKFSLFCFYALRHQCLLGGRNVTSLITSCTVSITLNWGHKGRIRVVKCTRYTDIGDGDATNVVVPETQTCRVGRCHDL